MSEHSNKRVCPDAAATEKAATLRHMSTVYDLLADISDATATGEDRFAILDRHTSEWCDFHLACLTSIAVTGYQLIGYDGAGLRRLGTMALANSGTD